MKTKIHPTPVVLAMIVTAFVSLLILVGQSQLDRIIHGDLYSFGLTFSYLWATPYWVYSALVIGFSWFSIIASTAITLHIFRGRKYQSPLDVEMEAVSEGQREQRRLAEYAEPAGERYVCRVNELDQEHEGVSEALIESEAPRVFAVERRSQPEQLSPTRRYDVRHPRDIIDSQC